MTALLAWVGVAAVVVAACAAQPPQGQPADSAAAARPAPSGDAGPPRPDTLRRPPERPLDARPWVPNTDSLRVTVDPAPAALHARPRGGGPAVRRVDGGGRLGAPRRPAPGDAPGGADGAQRGVGPRGVRVRGRLRPRLPRGVRGPPGGRKCGSGDATQVAGQGWLEVRITPAQAHTDAGRATIAERERRLALPVLKELEQTCDFEGDVTWVLGVASPNRYRVTELTGPARLVVDVRH